jgi:hypothetical protein
MTGHDNRCDIIILLSTLLWSQEHFVEFAKSASPISTDDFLESGSELVYFMERWRWLLGLQNLENGIHLRIAIECSSMQGILYLLPSPMKQPNTQLNEIPTKSLRHNYWQT